MQVPNVVSELVSEIPDMTRVISFHLSEDATWLYMSCVWSPLEGQREVPGDKKKPEKKPAKGGKCYVM